MGLELSTRARWVTLAAVLAVEYLALSLVVDTGGFRDGPGPWQHLAFLGVIAPLGVVIGAAALLRFIIPSAEDPVEPEASVPVQGLPALAHGIAAIAAVVAARFAFDPDRSSVWALALFFGFGLTALGTIALTLFPRRTWPSRAVLGAAVAAVGVGLVAYLIARATVSLWDPLGPLTFAAVALVMASAAPEALIEPGERYLAVGEFAVAIDPVCSGYEGIGLAGALMLAHVLLARESLRTVRALWLVPLAILAAWLGNVIRIVGLMLIGAYVSAEVAFGAFHSKAGWIAFSLVTLGVAWLGHHTTWFRRDTPGAHAAETPWENPRTPYLLPLLVLVGTALVTGAFAQGLDLWYGLRILAVAAAVAATWRQLRPLLEPPTPLSYLVGVSFGLVWVAASGAPVPLEAEARATLDALGPTLSASWVGVRWVGSVAVVPLCEELAFRGFLLRWLARRDFDTLALERAPWWALGVSSLVFGLLHPEHWMLATLAGAAYGGLAIRSGRVSDAIVAHALTNAVIGTHVLIGGAWQHWT